MQADVDDLVAVQAALEEAQQALQDLEYAYSLQKEEFFDEDALDSSNSVAEARQALEMQVSWC